MRSFALLSVLALTSLLTSAAPVEPVPEDMERRQWSHEHGDCTTSTEHWHWHHPTPTWTWSWPAPTGCAYPTGSGYGYATGTGYAYATGTGYAVPTGACPSWGPWGPWPSWPAGHEWPHGPWSSSTPCSKNGEVLCNGRSEFGVCNSGRVTFRPVYGGAACVNNEIVYVGKEKAFEA